MSAPPRNPMYAANTPPAIVAIPPLIKHKSSDVVIFFMYGLTSNGDSVCPKKIFPTAAKLSEPDKLKNFFIHFAKNNTTFCKTP